MRRSTKRKRANSAKKRRRTAEKRSVAKSKGRPLLGFMEGQFEIVGDIESPLPDWAYWHPEKNL
jgi:hypothetical protein